MLIEIILFGGTVLLTYYLYSLRHTKNNDLYFEKRNVKTRSNALGFKMFLNILFNRYTFIDFANVGYYAFPDEPIYGYLELNKPTYYLRDPEIIKKITIKDFDYFEDHNGFTDEKTDPLWGNSLVLMKGHKWRQMRATLSPAFTGSKMRQMFELVSECVERTVGHLKQRIESGEKLNIEMKDLFTRYANDVIASCAFGLKIDSFAEPDNQFFLDSKQLSNFAGSFQAIKMMFMMTFPKLARALNMRFTDPLKFNQMVLDTIEYRKKNGILRPDMINIMMQVRDGSLKYQAEEKSKDEGFATVEESDVGKANINRTWNDDEIVAQCFLFLVAGFETTSTMLTFTAFELVANPDIQQKLYDEIAEVNEQLGGKRINYDALQKMKYLDQVVSEVLRKWPPSPQLDRVCVKDYNFDDGDNLKFNIEKGSNFFISIYGIHHDPKYYSDPEKFDPERFSDENKSDIKSGTYFPFGNGPRNCIGSRFALMEMKAILYNLLLNFSFEVNEKTDIPFKLKKSFFSLTMKNGMNLELKLRSVENRKN